MASALLIGSGDELEDNPRRKRKRATGRKRGRMPPRGKSGRFKKRGSGTRRKRRASSSASPRRRRRTRAGYTRPRARKRTRRTSRKRARTTTIVVRNGATLGGLKSAAKAALPILAGFGAGLLVTPGVRSLILRGRDSGWMRHGTQAGLSFGGYLLLRKTKFGIPFLAGGLMQLGIGLVQQYAPQWAGRLALDGSGSMSGLGCSTVGRLHGVRIAPGMGDVRFAQGLGYVRRAAFAGG